MRPIAPLSYLEPLGSLALVSSLRGLYEYSLPSESSAPGHWLDPGRDAQTVPFYRLLLSLTVQHSLERIV